MSLVSPPPPRSLATCLPCSTGFQQKPLLGTRRGRYFSLWLHHESSTRSLFRRSHSRSFRESCTAHSDSASALHIHVSFRESCTAHSDSASALHIPDLLERQEVSIRCGHDTSNPTGSTGMTIWRALTSVSVGGTANRLSLCCSGSAEICPLQTSSRQRGQHVERLFLSYDGNHCRWQPSTIDVAPVTRMIWKKSVQLPTAYGTLSP